MFFSYGDKPSFTTVTEEKEIIFSRISAQPSGFSIKHGKTSDFDLSGSKRDPNFIPS
jgi:hypothetical protein